MTQSQKIQYMTFTGKLFIEPENGNNPNAYQLLNNKMTCSELMG